MKMSVLWFKRKIKIIGRKKKKEKKREGRPVGHRIVYAQLDSMIMTFVLYQYLYGKCFD